MAEVDPFAALLAELRELLTSVWYFWALLALLIVGKRLLKLRKALRLRRAGIAEIDVMDGTTFERYLLSLFRRLGYQARHTGRRGDFGADLVAEKDGRRIVVQAKRSSRTVGIDAVQEAVSAVRHYDCSAALVVTNAWYSRAAKELAGSNGVELWDRDALVEKILTASGHSEATLLAEESAAHCCAACGDRVTEKVRQFCLTRPHRFGGRVYCYGHQRTLAARG